MYNLHIFYLAPLMFSRKQRTSTLLKLRANLIESSCLIFVNCFLPCMWPQVIDLFPSKQAGIVGMVVSFSIAWGIAWLEGRSLAWSLPIVSFHAWLLFPSMHVALGDRFVSFKVSEDRRDDNLFFYRAGYHTAEREERPKKLHKKIVLLLFFLVAVDTPPAVE